MELARGRTGFRFLVLMLNGKKHTTKIETYLNKARQK